MKYNHKKIEKKWQKEWEDKKIYKTKDKSDKPKFYCLDMFPYPSGAGLHVGHPRGYIATDVIARFKMLQGFNVLHPMGWDAFGLPAENYALKHKVHPREAVEKNIKQFKKQLEKIGLTYDWSREINTTDPEYYKWTQWIFLQLFKIGLAYESEEPINWCPGCRTGLANEDLEDGKCERCGSVIEKKLMRQWVLKMTDYAEKLLRDLEYLPEWEEQIKEMQRNWIGKSEGIEVVFKLVKSDKSINVFTTRVDTLFSGTFLILAPEHPLIKEITTPEQKQEVEKYIKETVIKTEIERTELQKEKSGVFTGAYVSNPMTGERMPVWISDFVLAYYGSGAVFADAHDQRDFEMAKKYNIPLKVSIRPEDEELWAKVSKLEECFSGDGILVNSGEFDGLTSVEARSEIAMWLIKKNLAKKTVNYKMRDWVFSRQRYWGEPIPIIHCNECGIVPVPEEDLPVKLPNVKKYEPTGTGESPLVSISKWVNVKCPKCKGDAKRETNTMPQWAGSCWYYLRYIDSKNKKALVDNDKERYWMPVDLYVGGAEHATRHLLYARFWHKVLYGIGAISANEPFKKFVHTGLVNANDGRKMSKRWGNVINPDDMIEQYGADALRLYEMFMGPFNQAISWNTQGLIGMKRFLDRIWDVVNKVNKNLKAVNQESKIVHKTIKKVTSDIDDFKFNTAISTLMECFNEKDFIPKLNDDGKFEGREFNKKALESFLILLSPFAPHIVEELWELIGNKKSIFLQKWPVFDEDLLQEDVFDLIIQINSKVRDKMEVTKDINKEEIEKIILKSDKIKKYLDNKKPKKIIYVPEKLVNIVV